MDAGAFENTGTHEFACPSEGFGSDWVLVLDDAARDFPKPAVTSRTSATGPSAHGSYSEAKRTRSLTDGCEYSQNSMNGLGDGSASPISPMI